MAVDLATEQDRAAWDEFVLAQSDASGYHEWWWREVIERAFGHECLYLMSRHDGRVDGVLPLVFIKSKLFGRTMTSLPFLNYGGVLTASEVSARALLASAAALARQRQCRYIELRHTSRRFADWPCKQHKVSMRLRLQPDLWSGFDRKVRNQIRKAEKSGLSVERGGGGLLEAFYAVFARNMRDLGTPVYPRRFFEEVVQAKPDRIRVLVVKLGDRPVAAAITHRTRNMVEIPWASSIRDYNSLCPNHLLYWRALEAAVAQGCDVFDLGRSTPNEGTYKFKQQWGSEPVPLHWEYWVAGNGDLPDLSPTNPKFHLAIRAWKRCPLWVANRLGPHIVRSLP